MLHHGVYDLTERLGLALGAHAIAVIARAQAQRKRPSDIGAPS
ncbi:MAG: hypothetical protein ABUS57_12670 [Pseudomonadota bacterium]